jgi:uncharacterized membrane protein
MHRTTAISLTLVGLLAITGCPAKSEKVGGPGATDPANRDKKTPGTPEQAFTLDVPNLATDIKQGESKVVTISINRGKNFDQDVTLSFENTPKGLSVDPARPVLKKGEKEVTFTIKAADDAALGTHVIKVAGTPTTGPAANNEFKVSVEKK